jgi:hypothetical protein
LRRHRHHLAWSDFERLIALRDAFTVLEQPETGKVRFTAGEFTAEIRFDEAGFVLDYPGIAVRAPGSAGGADVEGSI